ncbi:MAG: hypothetical protein WCE45_08940 [Sedimentisphaerales bacterium]
MRIKKDRIVTLKLPRLMVGQIIDGLRERQKVWMYTAEFMETGNTEEPCIIEECSDADEARNIAAYYEEIITSIDKQLDKLDSKNLGEHTH